MIKVFTGPMFSGKSTRLFEEYNKIYNKENILVFKPRKDIRTKKYIRCRNKEENIEANLITNIKEIYDTVLNNYNSKNKIIFIDEAQFLEGDVISLLDLSVNFNFDIYIAGLNLTSELKPFGLMPNILSIADSVEYLEGSCYYCNKPAKYTKCLVDKKEDILVRRCR